MSYASTALNESERKYGITELETLAVVWGISHFHHLLYGHNVTVYTDHTAVKAVLEAENPTAKHVHWWMRVYGRGIKNVKILYRAGKENSNADALSRSPYLPAPAVGIAEDEVQVSALIAGSFGGGSSHGPALLGREIEGETSHSTVSPDEYNPSQEEMKQSTEDNQLAPHATPQPRYAENPARARRRIQKLQERVVLFSQLPFPSAEEDGPTPDLPQNPVAQNPVASTATGTSSDRVEPGAMMNTESRKQAVSTHSSVYPLLGSYESLNSPPTQPHHFFITQTEEGVSVTFLYRLEPPPLPNSRYLDVQDPVNSPPDPTPWELQDSQSHTEEDPAAVHEEMCLDKVMETRVTLQREEDGKDTSRNTGASTAEEKQNEQHSVPGQSQTAPHSTNDSLESQTAPHSTNDSLESQTAPHSTTDSLESQTAPHSTTDSLESQTAPTLGQQIGQQEPAQTSPQDQRSLQAVTTGKQNYCIISGQEDSARVCVIEPEDTQQEEFDLSSLLRGTGTHDEHDAQQTLALEQANDPEIQQLIGFIEQIICHQMTIKLARRLCSNPCSQLLEVYTIILIQNVATANGLWYHASYKDNC